MAKIRNLAALEGVEALTAHGFPPRAAPIRSSSFKTWKDDPFRFLLIERFGIRKSRRLPPPALWLGRCTHICWEGFMKGLAGATFADFARASLSRAIEEIEETIAAEGHSPLTSDERKDLIESFHVASTWADVAWSISGVDFSRYRVVMSEELLNISPRSSPFTSPIVLRLDALLHDTLKNELWIWDGKTTSYPTGVYLESRRYAIQPRLYRTGVHLLLEDQVWRDSLGVGNAPLAGFIHYAMAKPSIRISKKTEKKDGEDAAKAEYLERCREWFLGVGEFKAEGEQRGSSGRTVNVQFRRFQGKEPLTKAEYEHLRHFDLACQRPIQMEHYPAFGDSLLPMFPSKTCTLSDYAPFYNYASDEGMKRWIPIIEEGGFVRSFREDGDEEGITL